MPSRNIIAIVKVITLVALTASGGGLRAQLPDDDATPTEYSVAPWAMPTQPGDASTEATGPNTAFFDLISSDPAANGPEATLARHREIPANVSCDGSSCDLPSCDGPSCDGCGSAGCEDCGWVDQLSEACKEKLSWNLGNGWRIKPFGQLRGEAIYSQAPQTADAVIIFLNPKQPGIEEDQSTVHGKTSQLSFSLDGPTCGGWSTGGLLVVNFLGPQPIRNQSGANIVNAYGEIKNDQWRFAFGRMFDLFGPIAPTTVNGINHRGAGDIGIFRGAFNVDRYITMSDKAKWTLSARISQQNILDYTFVPEIRGKDAGWPNIEARIGLQLGSECDYGRPFEIGCSGFVGETQAVADSLLTQGAILLAEDDVSQSSGFAIDLQLKGPRFGVRGEGWWGKGAGTYFVATLQNANPQTNVPIESVGGWGELYFKWSNKTTLHGGYGIDDPLDSRLGFFPGGDIIGGITLNDVGWINVMHQVTDSFQLALEVSHRRTQYLNSTFDNSGMVYHMASTLKF